MIRHAAASSTVSATSLGVHSAPPWSCLIAAASFPLPLAVGLLRARSDAVDLAPVTPPTDKHLPATAGAQEHPAGNFIETFDSAYTTRRIRELKLWLLQQFPALRACLFDADLGCGLMGPQGLHRGGATEGVDMWTTQGRCPHTHTPTATNSNVNLATFGSPQVRIRPIRLGGSQSPPRPHAAGQLHRLCADPGSRSQATWITPAFDVRCALWSGRRADCLTSRLREFRPSGSNHNTHVQQRSCASARDRERCVPIYRPGPA
jgi:hypothetical protein